MPPLLLLLLPLLLLLLLVGSNSPYSALLLPFAEAGLAE
jgi:hypothetical protein